MIKWIIVGVFVLIVVIVIIRKINQKGSVESSDSMFKRFMDASL